MKTIISIALFGFLYLLPTAAGTAGVSPASSPGTAGVSPASSPGTAGVSPASASGPGIVVSQFQSKAFDNLWINRDKLNAYTRALLALAAHNFGYHD